MLARDDLHNRFVSHNRWDTGTLTLYILVGVDFAVK